MRMALRLIMGISLGFTNLKAKPQQFKVYGKVLDSKTKQAFESVTVFVRELNVQTNTDAQGYYELLLPQGRHQLEVFSLGMTTEAKTINLTQDTKVDFTLVDFAEELQ